MKMTLNVIKIIIITIKAIMKCLNSNRSDDYHQHYYDYVTNNNNNQISNSLKTL